jgi:hypothetical protein
MIVKSDANDLHADLALIISVTALDWRIRHLISGRDLMDVALTFLSAW